MLNAKQLHNSTNPELVSLLKTRLTGYWKQLIQDELRSRILLNRKYSGVIS